jgi:hypothetical protein
MEYSPYREANGLSAGEEVPHLLWNPEIHCLVHKSLPLVSVLNHINIINFQFKPYFFTVHFNMIILCLGLERCIVSSYFTAKIAYISPIHATCPTHLISILSP